jgi:hypothetical protein
VGGKMKIGSTIQMISFELSLGCNLTHIHPQCPSSLGSSRYQLLQRLRSINKEDAVKIVKELYDNYDFRGWVGLSFYNEPLLYLDRIVFVAESIKEFAPEIRFTFTTNGTCFPDDMSPLKIFDWIGVTNYRDLETPDEKKLEELKELIGEGTWDPPRGLFVTEGRLDKRIQSNIGEDRSHINCLYPFKDFAIDYYGNCHICCFDWLGKAGIGNILTDGVERCMANWERIMRSITVAPMKEDAPDSCRYCKHVKFKRLDSLNEEARQAAKLWLKTNANSK